MNRGKLIVLEGTDGSGKTTQLNLLLHYLKQHSIPHAYFDFPQYEKTFFGNFVGKFLNGEFGHISRINPYLAMFPYAGDRWQVKDSIFKNLKDGKIVVCNRYAPSIAYQLAKVKAKDRNKFYDWATALEYKIFAIPKEDLVIFLYVPFATAQKLIEKKGKRSYLNGKSKDQYEENVSYLERVEQMYLWLTRHGKNWQKVECVKNRILLSPDEIHKKVVNILQEKMII